MLTIAKLRYLRIAPRKVRLAADLIRGKSIEKAQVILNFTVKKPALPLLKLLKQAVANAKDNQKEVSALYISKITVDEGPKLKRWRARARGRAFEIQKKTSHITLVLDAAVEKKLKKIKKMIKIKKTEQVEKAERDPKIEKPKLRPGRESFNLKTKKGGVGIGGGIKKIFRRKAF